ncbi:MAG TPA: metal ABC transporter permease [Actinomycetota bacterium]
MSAIIAALPYPFDLGFMERALVAGVIVGIFAPMIGTFVVQRRMSLIGDGIGHVAFAGVGAGLVLGVSPVWAALALAVAGALGVEWLRSRRAATGDLALALFFFSGIAAGVVLVSIGGGLDASLLGYLFGQPLTVDDGEIVTIVALGVVVVSVVLVLRRSMFSVVTDEEWSRVAGLPVGLLNSTLAVLIAVSVVAAMRIVGILLIAALMVLPVASGQLVARSFRGTMWWSVAFGVASVIAGLAASRIWGVAPGGAIVLISAAAFGVLAIARRGAMPRIPAEGAGL